MTRLQTSFSKICPAISAQKLVAAVYPVPLSKTKKMYAEYGRFRPKSKANSLQRQLVSRGRAKLAECGMHTRNYC